MDHANSVPLQRHYLGREIDKDLFSILRGIKSQHTLVKQSCSIGHFISKRRPVDLLTEQSASLNTHPLIRRLTLRLRNLRKGSGEYMEVHQSRTSTEGAQAAEQNQMDGQISRGRHRTPTPGPRVCQARIGHVLPSLAISIEAMDGIVQGPSCHRPRGTAPAEGQGH